MLGERWCVVLLAGVMSEPRLSFEAEKTPKGWYTATRYALIVVWILLAGRDLREWLISSNPTWTIIMLVLTDVWGWLDAVLRYPVVHDIDSLFALKHSLLLVAKLVWLTLAFIASQPHPHLLKFVFDILACIIVPTIYCLLLPVDESPADYRFIVHGVVDEDIATRLVRVVTNPAQFLKDVNTWRRRWMRRSLEQLADNSPRASQFLRELSPTAKQLLRKPNRSV